MTVIDFIKEQNENARMGFISCKDAAEMVLCHLEEVVGDCRPHIMREFMFITEATYVSYGYDELIAERLSFRR